MSHCPLLAIQKLALYYTADGTKDEQEMWSLIRNLETRLRTLIMNGYSERWGEKAEVKMREFLGEDSQMVSTETVKRVSKRISWRINLVR